MGWSELREQYLRSLTPLTGRSYRRTLRAFSEWTGRAPDEVNVIDVRSWLDSLRTDGCRESTVNQRLAALKSWYRWLTDGEMVARDPTRGVRIRRVQRYGRSRRPLDQDELRRLLAAATPRTRAWILCHLLTGLRRAEVAGLCPPDLWQGPHGWMIGAAVKGGKVRRRSLPGAVVDALVAWRGSMAEVVGGQDDVPIWQASSAALAHELKATARRAGLDVGRVHVHGLRHCATLLRRRAGADIKEIQEFLGHADPGVTMVYLAHLEAGEARDERADQIGRDLLGPE